jgi:hypothetical protein
MNKFHKIAVAGLAGVAMIASSVVAPSQAEAKHGLLAAGAIGLGLGLALSKPVYGGPVVYGAPVYQPTCWWQKQFTGYYNQWGQPIYKNVQVCG